MPYRYELTRRAAHAARTPPATKPQKTAGSCSASKSRRTPPGVAPSARRTPNSRVRDALVCATGTLGGSPAVVAAMEYGFIGGSMGVVVGEKVTRSIERALALRAPLVVVSCSGGARMMEGTLSLMQMAKISAALARLDDARLPFISVLTDPTTGGVSASFAMMGDIAIAEPGAVIGFAGARVIEETIREKLPPGFQRAEYLLEHGMVDMVVPRGALKETLVRLIALIAAPEGIERIHRDHPDISIVVASVDRALNEKGYIVPGLGDAGDRLYGTK